jgi:hypothetical protein
MVRGAGRGFFPLDEELELLSGKLTPREHERLVRLSGWVPFERAAELLEEFLGIAISKGMAQYYMYTETAWAIYVQMQEEEVLRLERGMLEAAVGAEKMQISADGAMVPLLHGIWAEVRTLVIGEVESSKQEQGEQEIHTRNLSYFSRKVSAQEFQRLALVEVQRRGVENAKEVTAVMDEADWEQNLVDFHCPQAVRILDFAHAAGHINQIGEWVHGEHTPESQAWLKERLHLLKDEGPDTLLNEFEKLQRKHPDIQVISSNLAYLKKQKAQLQYPLFQAQGWPIGSGIVESGNKLVAEARLKGAGMHCRLAPSCSRHEWWAEAHVNPILAIRNILCSNRWKEEWPKIEARLRKQIRQRRKSVHQTHHPPRPTTLVARALQGDFGVPFPEQVTQEPISTNRRKIPGETSSMARPFTSALLLRKFKPHPRKNWILTPL